MADAVGVALRSDEDKAHIMREIGEALGVRVFRKKPERYRAAEHAAMLRCAHSHVASVQPQGTECLLFLTRLNLVGVCVCIERKVHAGHFHPNMTLVHLTFHNRLFDGTLLQGVLTTTNSTGTGKANKVLLVDDMLVEAGERLVSRPDITLAHRAARLQRVLSSELLHVDASDAIAMRAAPYVSVPQLRNLVKHVLPSLEYPVHGLRFRPFSHLPNEREARPDIVFTLHHPRSPPQVRPHHHHHHAKAARSDDSGSGSGSGSGYGSSSGSSHDEDVEESKLFFTRRTAMPDVYELFEREADVGVRPCDHTAGVLTIDASRRLSLAFTGVPVHSAVVMPFVFNRRFSRWVLAAASSDVAVAMC